MSGRTGGSEGGQLKEGKNGKVSEWAGEGMDGWMTLHIRHDSPL